MANNRKDYNWLCSEICERVVSEFTDLDEVGAKFLYTDILKAVKENTWDDKIDCLRNLSFVLRQVSKIKNPECLRNYQHSEEIGHFNLVSLACKNKAVKVLEYVFSEETQTFYNLSIQVSELHENESLLSVKDEFSHNAFYYAVRSNMTDLLRILIDKSKSLHSDEGLDDLLSKSYKELKLRNISLTKDMQLFIQSKILDLRFFQESATGNSGTGNSWDQIKKRIEVVVKYAQSIKKDYWDEELDEKFIFVAECIAKSIHVLKFLLKSTYDRLPWEEIEFCLTIFIRCCKDISEQNLVYNCVLSKKRMLMHLFNFATVLEIERKKFENPNVRELAKSVSNKTSRGELIKKISTSYSEFLDLYDDYEKIRDFCSLEIIKSYSDLIDSSSAPVERKPFLVSRILQVMGEHFKNSHDSPKLSTSTADLLLSFLSSNTRDIITNLRDSLSHEQSLQIRSEIEKKKHLFKSIHKDISKINGVILEILYVMRTSLVKTLIDKIKLCKSSGDLKEFLGPYRLLNVLYPKEIKEIHRKGDLERLEELVLNLDNNINNKTKSEKMFFEQIYNLIMKEKKKFENLKQTFYHTAAVASIFNEGIFADQKSNVVIDTLAYNFSFLPSGTPSENLKSIVNLLDAQLQTIFQRIKVSDDEDREVCDVLLKILFFLKFEFGYVKWIEEFKSIVCHSDTKSKRNKKLSPNISKNLLITKFSQLKEALIGFDLMDGTSIADFLSFERNMELRAITEMLVLDILGILENTCSRNPFFLDNDYPSLGGKNMRNHLAHGNILMDVCLGESSAQLLVKAKKLLTLTLPYESKNLDRVIQCDCIKLECSIEHDLGIMNNQRKLFVALEKGNMEERMKYINAGADVYGRDCQFSSCLHFAAKAPDTETLKWVLQQGVDINLKDSAGQSFLHVASKFNRMEAIRHIVEENYMYLDVSDLNKKTPLHVAVENQSNDVVKYISKLGITTTIKDKNGLNPFFTAAYWNNKNAAEILLEKEIGIDLTRSHGYLSALHIAALRRNLELVKLLIEKKANVDVRDDFGRTPLVLATTKDNLEIVKTLVENGSDVNAEDETGMTPLQNAVFEGSSETVQFLLQHGANIDFSNCEHFTPLMIASKYGHFSIAELLLEKGAFVSFKNKFGNTALHFAAERGHYEIVQLLLNQGADIHSKSNVDETSLHSSAYGGNKKIVILLLEKGADINSITIGNVTALHLAAKLGHKDVVELLIEEGADINCKTIRGSTPLHFAASNANRDIVKILLSKGAYIKAIDAEEITVINLIISKGLSDLLMNDWKDKIVFDIFSGYTLLHLAALHGDQKIVEYCIENSCDINARSYNSKSTPLHFAAEGDHPKTVDFLLLKGSEINAEDSDGRVPLIIAVERNNKETVAVLASRDKNAFLPVSYDKILSSFEHAVRFGYCDVIDILLEHYKFDFSKEQEKALLKTAVSNNHKYAVDALLKIGFEINCEVKPLHVAVYRRHYEMVEFLLSKGANPNVLDADNCTPFDIAVKLGDIDMIEILLLESTVIPVERKFILSAAEFSVRADNLDVIELLLQMKVIDVNVKCTENYTLLHTSALAGSLCVSRYLVAEGADINAKDGTDRKPVHIAAEKGFQDMVDFYLNYPDLEEEIATLLLIASSNGKTDVCKLLLQKVSDVNKIYFINDLPLELALKNGHKEVFSILLHYGAYYNVYPPKVLKPHNDTAPLLKKIQKLFIAVKNNSASEVEALLEEENNLEYCFTNVKCVKKETVLHYASWKGYEKIVDILLKYNANPNARTKTGETPLHYAVKFSHAGIAKLLLSNGAMYNSLSETGNSPLDYAVDHETICLLLFLNYIFAKVQKKDILVLKILKEIEEGAMKIMIRARNSSGKTLIDVAHFCGFPKTDELELIFKTDYEFMNLAMNYFSGGRYAETALTFKIALRNRISIFGANSQPVLDLKMLLAGISGKLGDFDEAIRISKEVYESRKSSLGEDHQKTLSDECAIASWLLKQGKTQEALRIFEKIHIKLKENPTADYSFIISCDASLCAVLFEMGRFDEVLKIYNAGKYTQGNFEDFRVLLTEFRCLIGEILQKQGKDAEALRLYEEIYTNSSIYDKTALKALRGIASVYYEQQKYDKALELFIKVLNTWKLHHPDDCFDILDCEYCVGKVLYSQGRSLSALKIFLSLESKIASGAPLLLEKNKHMIDSIKYELSLHEQGLFDKIQNQVRIANFNYEM